ncbi:MAG TPA: hypothetical protein VH280_03420 [Verrucomicrobiae bacterium]|jgi:hypothetical protein|nr:hypothetical protein [Verrucomicrobiae bacterium]
MENSYSNRHYLLPTGCKDLIDAIHLPRQIHAEVIKGEEGIIFKIKVSELRLADAEIMFEGRHLRIIENCPGKTRRERTFYISRSYNMAKALTTYTGGEVRIFVPRC